MSDSLSPFSEGKLGCARMVVAAIGCLVARDYPVPAALFGQLGDVEAEVDRQRLGCALTRLVLSALVVELVIKHAWEIARSKTAPCTHDVTSLYNELPSDVGRAIRNLYDECLSRYSEAVRYGRNQGVDVDVSLADFDEALEWNKVAIRDLKYEMTPSGKSVPYGVFWGSETIWVPGHDVPLPNYAVELVHWATGFYP